VHESDREHLTLVTHFGVVLPGDEILARTVPSDEG
jgi:hypothetical protein